MNRGEIESNVVDEFLEIIRTHQTNPQQIKKERRARIRVAVLSVLLTLSVVTSIFFSHHVVKNYITFTDAITDQAGQVDTILPIDYAIDIEDHKRNRFLPGDASEVAYGDIDMHLMPYGRIMSPAPGSLTLRDLTLSGYTENIPFDRPFVWMVVDVPELGLCWPKKVDIKRNEPFQVKIHEGGPNQEYTVSLYAVGYRLNAMIEQWIEHGIFGGLPMIPKQYRLDSIKLALNNI